MVLCDQLVMRIFDCYETKIVHIRSYVANSQNCNGLALYDHLTAISMVMHSYTCDYLYSLSSSFYVFNILITYVYISKQQ